MKSSFQELMELVSKVASKDPHTLCAILKTLKGLRRTFERDRDLLEAVIRRVELELKSHS